MSIFMSKKSFNSQRTCIKYSHFYCRIFCAQINSPFIVGNESWAQYKWYYRIYIERRTNVLNSFHSLWKSIGRCISELAFSKAMFQMKWNGLHRNQTQLKKTRWIWKKCDWWKPNKVKRHRKRKGEQRVYAVQSQFKWHATYKSMFSIFHWCSCVFSVFVLRVL